LILKTSVVKEKERRQLEKQASRLEPEVLTLETLLGFSVEGAGSEWSYLVMATATTTAATTY